MTLRRTVPSAALTVAGACALAQSDGQSDGEVAPLESEDSAYSVFLLIKATPAWLALSPDASATRRVSRGGWSGQRSATSA